MSYKGIGYNLHVLFDGNDSTVKALAASQGKQIAALELITEHDGSLHMTFTDGSRLIFRDDARSCCESRYMTTDDTLSIFVGATFLGAETKDAPNRPDEYGEHEVQFLVITTSLGQFTMETHNEHNGYYGGFWLVAELITQEIESNE